MIISLSSNQITISIILNLIFNPFSLDMKSHFLSQASVVHMVIQEKLINVTHNLSVKAREHFRQQILCMEDGPRVEQRLMLVMIVYAEDVMLCPRDHKEILSMEYHNPPALVSIYIISFYLNIRITYKNL